MSYNIDSTEIINLDLAMKASDVLEFEDSGPECCFIEDMIEVAESMEDKTSLIKLPNFDWYGEGSGRSYSLLLEEIISKLVGTAEIIFFWEGGNSVSGLKIKDGKYKECDVKHILEEKGEWK